MLFNSIEFIIYFPIVVIVFFLLPFKWRWIWLLAASCFFYMAFTPYYILLLLAVAIVDYFSARKIESVREKGKGNPKLYLILGIVFPLAILFVFKYYNFFNETVSDIAGLLHLNYSPKILKMILPVGISFYTFQSLSYVIEVYRGNFKVEKHFGIYTLFVTFFPQLVAGPIERPQNLLKQFFINHKFEYQRAADGLKLMAWGFFKKLVIADRLAFVVNEIFNNPTQYNGVHSDYQGIHFIVATVFFCLQIYCDFSGYSDIAIGGARVMGFRLMENFRRPFLARNINDLWRRWHISMITWFRDYVYIPMGGNRVSYWRWQYNIFVMFIVSGIWHGANWTFVIWAGLNGVYILVSIWTSDIRSKIVKALRLEKAPFLYSSMQVAITFCLFAFAAIFFRANTVTDAFYIISHFFDGIGNLIKATLTFDYNTIKSLLIIPAKGNIWGFAKPAFMSEMVIAILSIAILHTVYMIQERKNIKEILSGQPWFVRLIAYTALVYCIVFLGVFANQQFIYFRF